MIDDGFQRVIGLDPSIVLLRSTNARLTDHFFPVLGVAENLPFRDGSVAGVITCYSLRDVRNKKIAVDEFARAVRKNGRLEIVDVGKPDQLFFRRLIGVYVVLAMPIVARFFIGRRANGNPFRMIIPTFHQLPTNQTLARLARQLFGSSVCHEFLFGGLVIIEATRTSLEC